MVDARAEQLRQNLTDALVLVGAEAPLQFAAMRARLGAVDAVISVGDAAALRLCVSGDPPWVAPWTGDGAVALALSEQTLARLLAGRSSIDEEIVNGSLCARGALADLFAFFEGLSAWLHGALRSPSLPKLHERCLAQSAGAPTAPAAGQKGTSPC